MPIFGALLVTMFTGLATWLMQFVAQKVAVALAYVAVLTTVTVAMLALLATVVAPLLSGIFATSWFGWMGLAFPPVSSACLTALATTWAGTTLYAWQREALRMAASV